MTLAEMVYEAINRLDYPFRDISVRIGDEYYPIEKVEVAYDSDVLDDGSLVIVVQETN